MEHASPAILAFILLFIIVLLWQLRRAHRGEEIHIRRIPGIDAIDQAVGRAVELGRPISFTFGLTGLGPLLYACLGVLRHVARKVARLGSRLYVPCNDPEVLAVADASLQAVYAEENRLSRYDPGNLRFLSSEQFAFASGYIGLLHRENVGSAFLFGQFAAESLVLAEAGQQIGAMQVAATTSNEQIPFFLTACDYTLFGEELFAAGAFLSRDPVQVGSMRAQDLIKLAFVIMILVGVLEATLFPQREQSFLRTVIETPWTSPPTESAP